MAKLMRLFCDVCKTEVLAKMGSTVWMFTALRFIGTSFSALYPVKYCSVSLFQNIVIHLDFGGLIC